MTTTPTAAGFPGAWTWHCGYNRCRWTTSRQHDLFTAQEARARHISFHQQRATQREDAA